MISVEQILHGTLAEYYAVRNCQKLWIIFPSYMYILPSSKPDTKIELAFTFIYGSFTFSFYVFLNNYSLYIVQVAVGFEYEGKTEKHESQKGWKYVVLVFKIIM